MSDTPIAPLPPEIDALLLLESEAYGSDDALKSEVLSRVEMALTLRAPPGGSGGGSPPPNGSGGSGGAGGSGPGGGASGLGAASRALGVAVAMGAFAAGAVVGGLAVPALRRAPAPVVALEPAASTASVAPVAAAAPSALAEVPDASAAAVVAAHVAPSAAPSSEPRAKPAEVAEGASDLVRERELIDAARAALSRGRPADALTATARHAQRWPRGQLAEEREVIAIQALVASGRRAEAERRAAAFKRAFASSVLIPAVDAALSTP